MARQFSADWFFNFAVGCLLLIASAATALGQSVPRDEPNFSRRIAEYLSRAMPDYEVGVKEALTLSVTPKSGSSVQVNLDRIWAFCSRNASDCDRAVNEYVSSVSATLKERDAPIDATNLRVVVRPESYVEQLRKMNAGGSELVAEALAGDLWVIAVADLPRSVKFLSTAELERLKLSKSEAMALGRHNTATTLRPMKDVVRGTTDQGFGIISGDTYESSRLALHEAWAETAKAMTGTLIVAVPAPDVVVYGDSGKRNAADALAAFARESARRAERPVSTTLFEWTPTGWRPYSR